MFQPISKFAIDASLSTETKHDGNIVRIGRPKISPSLKIHDGLDFVLNFDELRGEKKEKKAYQPLSQKI